MPGLRSKSRPWPSQLLQKRFNTPRVTLVDSLSFSWNQWFGEMASPWLVQKVFYRSVSKVVRLPPQFVVSALAQPWYLEQSRPEIPQRIHTPHITSNASRPGLTDYYNRNDVQGFQRVRNLISNATRTSSTSSFGFPSAPTPSVPPHLSGIGGGDIQPLSSFNSPMVTYGPGESYPAILLILPNKAAHSPNEL